MEVADVVGYSRLVDADEAGMVARLKTLQIDLIHPMINEDSARDRIEIAIQGDPRGSNPFIFERCNILLLEGAK
jgi:hypothetical protein